MDGSNPSPTRPYRGLMLMEWAMLAYAVATLPLIFFMRNVLESPGQMVLLRLKAAAVVALLWGVYVLRPCRPAMMLRLVGQLLLLGEWYPETFDFNRHFPNLDHLFAACEQWLFGFQPALVFCREWSSPWVSELLTLGYESYYPLMLIVPLYYLIYNNRLFPRSAFIIVASFFLFYVVFLFLPAGGPQYYYPAAGIDNIAQGVFPDLGLYFEGPYEGLPIPGYEHGPMYHTLQVMHAAGERPTAAFPSSHVGVTVVVLLLAWHSGCRKLFWSLLPFGVLMFFATFYIQAHYAIDAVAGLLAGALFYALLGAAYRLLSRGRIL